MGTPEVTLVAFASIVLIALAAALVMRDLLFPQRAGVSVGTGARRLRRSQTVFDESPPRSLSARIDQGFDRLVLETGYELSPAVAFLLLLCCALALGGGMWLYFDDPLAGVAGGVAGLLAPLAVMMIRRSRRMAQVREELPHVLEMLARGTRAGQSIEQVVQLVAAEAGGVLGPEFRRCSQQLEMGRSFDRTLKTLAGRVRTVEMRILATTLIVQRQSGGRLSETLERMAGVVRDRLNAHRQIKASTGAGRTSTLIIASVAPIAYAAMFLLHRPHVQYLFDDPLGRLLLLLALVLEVLGLAWVFFLLRREE